MYPDEDDPYEVDWEEEFNSLPDEEDNKEAVLLEIDENTCYCWIAGHVLTVTWPLPEKGGSNGI